MVVMKQLEKTKECLGFAGYADGVDRIAESYWTTKDDRIDAQTSSSIVFPNLAFTLSVGDPRVRTCKVKITPRQIFASSLTRRPVASRRPAIPDYSVLLFSFTLPI
jgi:hypothetical protein